MTHVSRKKLPKDSEKFLNEALVKILANLNDDGVNKVFSTLFTTTEIIMLRKRLGILMLLEEGLDSEQIAKSTGTTRQTVARIRLQLLEISDTDKKFLIEKIKKWKNTKAFKNFIKETLEIPISRSEFRKKISPF